MSPSKEDLHAALTPVVDALCNGLEDDLLTIVLFGSQARGEAAPESDWDLLVIARNLPPRPLARHLYLKTMLPDSWRARVGLLAKTPQEFEARVPALYLDIALDGVVLSDPQRYITPRLAWVRRQIEIHGMERQRFGRDLMWRTPAPARIMEWEKFA